MKTASKLLSILILLAIPHTLTALPAWLESAFPTYHAHRSYQEKDYAKAQGFLEKKLVEKPNDPLLNYNLGTIYYKQKKYESAVQSFCRAATHAFSKDDTMVEQSRFNRGNALYQQTIQTLGPNWEKEKLDDQARTKAIDTTKQAIEAYEKTVSINKDSIRAKTNKKKAEELLQKLQQKQQDKQDKDKDKDKDKQEEKDKDKQKQDKQDKEKKDQQDKQDKQKQDKKEQKDEKETKQDKKSQKQQEQDKEKEPQPADKPPEAQPPMKEENLEKRRMAAMLHQLEEKEKDLQKKLFQQKVRGNIKPDNKFQKPW